MHSSSAPKVARGKAKKRKEAMSWCWYCDREFEDDRVLLLHQKAKHFKCPQCPRRLNTAGGLAVHIDQVHKLPTDKIENALPGRDSFDVEIYGMVGVPKDDLAEWKRRKAAERGVEDITNRPKRAKIDLSVISASDLSKALATHRALMSGQIAPSALVAPPPGLPALPPIAAPVSMPGPGAVPVPPGFPMLPPGMPVPPPGFPFSAPPGMPMPPAGFPGIPPPGFPALPGMPAIPGMPAMPGLPGIPGMPPFPMPGAAAPPTAAAAPAVAQALEAPRVLSSSVLLKPGQMLLYGDNEVSPEEKRASQPKYAVPAVQHAESNSGGRATAQDFI